MIQPLFNGMLAILLAKFFINDLPHAAGLTGTDYERKPTTGQLRYIAILCQQLKMTVVYEEQVRTFGEAGRMIRELEAERAHRRGWKRLKGGNPNAAPIAPGVTGQRFTPETMDLMEDGFRTVENGAQIGNAIDEWTRREPGSIMNVVKLTRGNFEYLDDLHRILRQQYGDKIIVWRGGEIREGAISVTTDRATAVMFSERLGAGGKVHQFFVDTNKVLAASPTMESELIVHASNLKPVIPKAETGSFRVERTTVDKVVDDLERTWHRIDSDMSVRMQSALSILKEVMGYYYEEECIVVWDNNSLVGVVVHETYLDKDKSIQATHIKELASFTHKPGVGKLLVEEVIRIGREEGSDIVGASYGPGAKGFYEGLGFVKNVYYPEGPTLVMYRLKSGNPDTMSGKEIARELGIRYDGIQEGIGMQFTDTPQTGTTFYANTLEEARAGLAEKRELFRRHEEPGTALGTCYSDAWRFLIKQGEGYLIHGSVQLTAEGARVNHAWVELPTGWVWEPQTKSYYTIEDFKIMSPIEEHRYTDEEAAVMAARTNNHGPWTAEERMKHIGR